MGNLKTVLPYVMGLATLIAVSVLAALHDLPTEVTSAVIGAFAGGSGVHAILKSTSNG